MSDDFSEWFERKGYKFLWVTSALTWLLVGTIFYLKINYPPKVCCCGCDYNNSLFQCGLDTSTNLFIHTLFGFENCTNECRKQGMILVREMNESDYINLLKSKQFPDPFSLNYTLNKSGDPKW